VFWKPDSYSDGLPSGLALPVRSFRPCRNAVSYWHGFRPDDPNLTRRIEDQTSSPGSLSFCLPARKLNSETSCSEDGHW